MRERFIQDNDGHWYMIPSGKEDYFREAVVAHEKYRESKQQADFLCICRCDHPSVYTFKDCVEDPE